VKNLKKIYNLSFLLITLFSTSLISLRTLKKVNTKDIKVFGSDIISKNDVVNNTSLKFPIRLIFIKTNLLEKELKENLSLKNVSVRRLIFPFGLGVEVNTRTPIAYGERILNKNKILGFVDKDGIFIKKQNADEKKLSNLTIKVFGWQEKFQRILSELLMAQEKYELEITNITFSPNGFLTIEEKELKTILLGFNPNLVKYQLQIINNLKNEFKKNNFSEKIDNIDLTDPKEPKIKVFKP
jgi:cell division protein FtsQ